jgi:hypothetical protein
MLNGATLALSVVLLLIIRAISVPLLSAFFGATIGFMFPETTQAFMWYIKFNSVAFWQLMLIVGSISMIWSLGSPTVLQSNKVN